MKGLLDLPHSELYRMRDRAKDQAEQDLLAGYEHRAFAREAVGENPLMALPITAAIPLYQLAKILRMTGSRSQPSWGQMGQGLLGVKEGLLGR